MPNYIRVKQINQGELTGFFVDSISSESGLLLAFASGAAYGVASGIILNETVLLTGNQNVSGNKTFLNNLNVSGDVTIAGTLRYNEIIDTTVTGNISGYTGIFEQVYADNLVYNTGNQNISGNKTFLNNFIVSGTGSIFPILQITGVNDISINGNSSFGNYVVREPYDNHKLFKTNYLRGTGLQNIQISGLKTNNIINVFSDFLLANLGEDPNSSIKSYQYIMVDGPIPNSYNGINITGGLYSGKGLRRFKTGPTIANGYKVIPSLQFGGALVTPKQKYLETVYNITVESGQGAIRPLTFNTPIIGTANNPIITLKFNFQADTGVCIVSGRYQDSTPIFTITGANYDFIQTERLMYHYHEGGGTYVRI